MKNVYLVSYEFYGEWALDCGACDYIGVYDNLDKATKKVKELAMLEFSEDEDRILSFGRYGESYNSIIPDTMLNNIEESINKFGFSPSKQFFVNVYLDKNHYDDGCDNGAIVITKMEVK